MARVVCDLPFMSSPCNGVEFVEDRGEWISEEVSDEAAQGFAAVPGYRIAGAPAAPEAPAAADPADTNKDGKVTAAERRAAAKKAQGEAA